MMYNHLPFRLRSAVVPVCAGLAMLASVDARADIATMIAGTAQASVDLSSSAGMYEWTLSGQNQLNQQWFWYGIGAGGPQYSIENGAALTWSQPTADHITAFYDHGSFGIQVNYKLISGGIGQSSIQESISITNQMGSALDIRFYQYSDFNLGGTPGGDQVDMDQFTAFQQKGTTAIAEGIIDPAATRFEANVTGGVGSTLYRLLNQNGLALNNNDSASGDVTWAYEWDFLIGGLAAQDILKDKSLSVTLVPEPSTFAFCSLGLGFLVLAQRRRQKS
jgi:PEP-CTERM motif